MGSFNGKTGLLAPAAALAVGVSYGLGGAINQIVVRGGISVLNLTVFQFVIATVILGLLTALFFRDRLSAKEVLQLCCIGVFCAGASIFYYLAVDMLGVGKAVAIQFQYVWLVVVIQCMWQRLIPNGFMVLSVFLVIAGSVMGSGAVDEVMLEGSGLELPGILCGVACAICQAMFIYLNGRVALDKKPIPRTFVIVLSGLAVMAIVSPDFFARLPEMLPFAPGGLAMGLIMSVIPCVCLAFASGRLDEGLVAILTSAELPVAVLTGVLLLGERVTVLGVAGVLLVLGSIVLAQVKGSFRPRKGKLANRRDIIYSKDK